MKTIENPWRGQGLVDGVLAEIPGPSVDAAAPLRLRSSMKMGLMTAPSSGQTISASGLNCAILLKK